MEGTDANDDPPLGTLLSVVQTLVAAEVPDSVCSSRTWDVEHVVVVHTTSMDTSPHLIGFIALLTEPTEHPVEVLVSPGPDCRPNKVAVQRWQPCCFPPDFGYNTLPLVVRLPSAIHSHIIPAPRRWTCDGS